MSKGTAFVELTESRMESARTVLRAEAEEYRKLRLGDLRIERWYEMRTRRAVNAEGNRRDPNDVALGNPRRHVMKEGPALFYQIIREIIQERIDGIVYSLELSNMQRDALEAEFLWPAHREPENSVEPDTAKTEDTLSQRQKQESNPPPVSPRSTESRAGADRIAET